MAKRLSKTDFDSKISEENISLVDFYSDSCVPCKILNPVLGEIEDENIGVNIYKVNVTFDGEIAEKYQVSSTPVLILFKNSKELDRKTGVQNKETLLNWIKSFSV